MVLRRDSSPRVTFADQRTSGNRDRYNPAHRPSARAENTRPNHGPRRHQNQSGQVSTIQENQQTGFPEENEDRTYFDLTDLCREFEQLDAREDLEDPALN